MNVGSLTEVLEEMRKGVYDFTVNGKCSGCGCCCSDLLPLSATEVKKIHAYIRSHHIRECVNIPPTNEPVRDLTCPFRDNAKRKCTIYPIRPAICRDFQCDKQRKQIEADRQMYHEKCFVVNMREEFYPKG